jgi:hypothetical protein
MIQTLCSLSRNYLQNTVNVRTVIRFKSAKKKGTVVEEVPKSDGLEREKLFLGLDVNSQSTGFTLLDSNGR